MFDLYVNSLDFISLSYKYDLTPERDPKVSYQADVDVEEQKIQMPNLWSNRDFITNIKEALNDMELQFSTASVNIITSTSSAVIHEIYDSIIEYSDFDDGLEKLELLGLPKASQLKF